MRGGNDGEIHGAEVYTTLYGFARTELGLTEPPGCSNPSARCKSNRSRPLCDAVHRMTDRILCQSSPCALV